MPEGRISNLFPPGNDGSQRGAGQIENCDGTGRHIFQTPQDYDPSGGPLLEGGGCHYDEDAGNTVTNVKNDPNACT